MPIGRKISDFDELVLEAVKAVSGKEMILRRNCLKCWAYKGNIKSRQFACSLGFNISEANLNVYGEIVHVPVPHTRVACPRPTTKYLLVKYIKERLINNVI